MDARVGAASGEVGDSAHRIQRALFGTQRAGRLACVFVQAANSYDGIALLETVREPNFLSQEMVPTVNEPTLLPVKPGTLSAPDKALLRKAGVIVIEHENPTELRLLRPSTELSGSEILRCAAKALLLDDKNYSRGSAQREAFGRAISEALGTTRHDG